MAYNNIHIFFMSGTGNALKAALKIRDTARDNNSEVQIISVDRIKKVDEHLITGSDLIGLCYPTHGFSLPWHMLRFIISLPQSNSKHVFLLNTRAGSKLFGLFLPGISGIAQWLPVIFLWIKGYKIQGLLPLDMPSNWISIHPGFSSTTVNSITHRCMKMTEHFAHIILKGKAYYRSIAFICIPLDILLIPISLGYMLVGRFFMAKTFVASYKCTHCNICIDNCPVGAIKKVHNHPFWTIHCESCMRCMNICPEKAIDTAHGYVVLLVFAFMYVPFFTWAYHRIMSFISTGVSVLDSLLGLTAFTAISIPFLIISYYLVAVLQKYKLTSMFFRLTSLTYYWKHYIATGIAIKEFKKWRIMKD